ncbi:MAG: hypothetical protein LUD12_13965 [Lachnospiraceae bacterium]|nr:hypothetical protein [Lachnospiraceae bacterium]
MAAAKKTEVVSVKPIDMRTVCIKIVGDSPLIVHEWNEKARKEILDHETSESSGKAKKKHSIKIPVRDFINSIYWLTNKPDINQDDVFTEREAQKIQEDCMKKYREAIKSGAKFGFPATAIKKASVTGAYGLGMTQDMRKSKIAFFIQASPLDHTGFLSELVASEPVMREDMVHVGINQTDIRHRAMFEKWEIPLTVKYNANGRYTLTDIINIINAGGATMGIGEWRNEKDGTFGMYHVEAADAVK